MPAEMHRAATHCRTAAMSAAVHVHRRSAAVTTAVAATAMHRRPSATMTAAAVASTTATVPATGLGKRQCRSRNSEDGGKRDAREACHAGTLRGPVRPEQKRRAGKGGSAMRPDDVLEVTCLRSPQGIGPAASFRSERLLGLAPMSNSIAAQPDIHSIVADLRRAFPDFAPTPLLDLSALAKQLGVAQVLAKNEACRPLGSFKSLGGTYAGLRALARAAGTDIAGLLRERRDGLPALICASDGNHGLAVAAAARLAGAHALIFLPASISKARVRRIEAQGARIEQVAGSYDDAVDEAANTAGTGAGILVSDTVNNLDDPIVRDVMAGYEVIAAEVRDQIEASGALRPTHLLVQAGVGGLAAALARQLRDWMAPPARIAVVEPEKAACVSAALSRGKVVRLPGDVSTAAEMLSCGEASLPAFEVLNGLGVDCLSVTEHDLGEVPGFIVAHGGPRTTPSGGAAIAGLRNAVRTDPASFGLTPDSRVLTVISERDLDEGA